MWEGGGRCALVPQDSGFSLPHCGRWLLQAAKLPACETSVLQVPVGLTCTLVSFPAEKGHWEVSSYIVPPTGLNSPHFILLTLNK